MPVESQVEAADTFYVVCTASCIVHGIVTPCDRCFKGVNWEDGVLLLFFFIRLEDHEPEAR